MTVDEKIKLVYRIIFALAIIGACLGYYSYELGQQKSIEQDDKISEIEKTLLSVIQYSKLNFDSPQNKSLFESFLRKTHNLTIEKLNEIIRLSKVQNKYELQKALAFYLSEEYADALKSFEKILNTSSEPLELAIANSYIGNILYFYQNKKGSNTLDYLNNAITIFNDNKLKNCFELEQKASTYIDLGIIYKYEGDKDKSFVNYNEALKIYDQLDKKYSKTYLINLGEVYQNIYSLYSDGSKIAKYAYLHKAYEYKKKASNINSDYDLSLLNTIISLVKFYSNKGDFKKAKSKYVEGEELLRKSHYKNSTIYYLRYAILNSNYGFTLKQKYHNSHSLSDLMEAIRIMKISNENFEKMTPFKSFVYKRAYANNVHNLGTSYTSLEDAYNSEKYLLEAIKLREELLSSHKDFISSTELGHSYLALAMLYDSVNPSPHIKIEYAKKAIDMYTPFANNYPYLDEWIEKADKIIEVE